MIRHHPHCRVNGGHLRNLHHGFICDRCTQQAADATTEQLLARLDEITDTTLGYATKTAREQTR